MQEQARRQRFILVTEYDKSALKAAGQCETVRKYLFEHQRNRTTLTSCMNLWERRNLRECGRRAGVWKGTFNCFKAGWLGMERL